MGLRAFVAVDARAPALGPALDEVARLPADLKVVPLANVHATLAFLGEIDPADVPRVEGAVRAASKGEAPFTVRLRGLGTFPPRGVPRIVWAGLAGAEPLVRIAARLADGLGALGLRTEARAFSPHVTLARARSPRGAEHVRRLVAERAHAEYGEARIAEVVLHRSHLAPEGPTYEAIARVPLEGAS